MNVNCVAIMKVFLLRYIIYQSKSEPFLKYTCKFKIGTPKGKDLLQTIYKS